MSFYLDTEPAGEEDDAKEAGGGRGGGSVSFFLDTSSSSNSHQQKKSKSGSDSRKRKRRKDAETAAESQEEQQQQASSGGEIPGIDGQIPKIYYRSVSVGELGRRTAAESAAAAAAAANSAVADATDGPPKSRRPRFSRQVLNSRFFDQVAAAASDGNAITGGGGGSGGSGCLEAFRPGELTDRLRQALGLESDQLATHIYRMRELGYPPGWLLEAMVVPTGVAIFDDSTGPQSEESQHRRQKQQHHHQEQQQQAQQQPKYDVTRLVKYPGFNCPLPSGVRDQHRQLGFPSMRLDDHLSTFIHFLAGRNQIQASDAYHTRRRRLARQSSEVADAEEEEEEEEDSSLDDLEARRLELLRQLEDDPELEELDSCSGGSANGEHQDDGEQEAEVIEDAEISLASTGAAVVGTAFGSPVFTNYNTAKLPNPNNFNRDIEQFRPYENLPSSANGSGGYAKVNEVVKKIRKSLPKIA